MEHSILTERVLYDVVSSGYVDVDEISLVIVGELGLSYSVVTVVSLVVSLEESAKKLSSVEDQRFIESHKG